MLTLTALCYIVTSHNIENIKHRFQYNAYLLDLKAVFPSPIVDALRMKSLYCGYKKKKKKKKPHTHLKKKQLQNQVAKQRKNPLVRPLPAPIESYLWVLLLCKWTLEYCWKKPPFFPGFALLWLFLCIVIVKNHKEFTPRKIVSYQVFLFMARGRKKNEKKKRNWKPRKS